MQIYISSGGFKKTPSEIINFLSKNGIADIEISGGLFEKNLKKKILKKKLNLNIHNYIPFYKDPFVFNLASKNKIISLKSIGMAKKAISLASKLNLKYYAFHAGFLFDPKINMLGDKPVPAKIFERREAMSEFLKKVDILIKYARTKKIKLLVENNVASMKQFKKFNYYPLMANLEETIYVMNKIGKDVGLLLDLAHLNVSSKTLKFSKVKFIKKMNKFIRAYHISNNDGYSDQNKEFSRNSWFWKYLKKDAEFCTIEVYSKKISILKRQLNIAKQKIF